MRILCFDVGNKRTGAALSDPAHMVALALQVYIRANAVREGLEGPQRTVADPEAAEIVVGLPKDLTRAAAGKGGIARRVCSRIERRTFVRAGMPDERRSSNEAQGIFEMDEVNCEKRRPFIDMMMPQIILQGYLDVEKNK